MCKRSFSEGNPSSLQLNSNLSACDARRALVAKHHNNRLKWKEKMLLLFIEKSTVH